MHIFLESWHSKQTQSIVAIVDKGPYSISTWEGEESLEEAENASLTPWAFKHVFECL